MYFSSNFYFGEHILKSQYRKIKSQLEQGSFDSKQEYWVIVIDLQGPNLFQCISTQEYCIKFVNRETMIVSGIVSDLHEFPHYVKGVIEKLLTLYPVINKDVLIKWLTGDSND